MTLFDYRQQLKDYRFILLALSWLIMLVVMFNPTRKQVRAVYDFTFIVDITRSMNAQDYQLEGDKLSRLAYVRHVLQETLLKLPCGSTVSLGVFTDRQSTLLFDALDVCSARSEIHQVVQQLDWRMAWAADSRIGKGLNKTLEMLQGRETVLVFLTDGQEAPPLNPRYRTDFSPWKGKGKGMIAGVGGLQNVPIPKYDQQGRRTGVYQQDEVPHRSTFGLPSQLPGNAGNYHSRNAPFGGAKVLGDQHLSRLYEDYLQQFSRELGWSYHRLQNVESWLSALEVSDFANMKTVTHDLSARYAIAALVLLVAIYLPVSLFKRR